MDGKMGSGKMGITKESYEEKMQELKHKQLKLGVEIDLYTKADKDYLLAVSKVLPLATRVKTIFESSEIHEKRALFNSEPDCKRRKAIFFNSFSVQFSIRTS
ncbi:MAG: hypothetical protein IT284_02755 [Bacteroidetes bacterium]|nr:hypothetical protein [Bacteroidota bacterium]